MNLLPAEVHGLPLAAALLHNDEQLAQTPEWPGAGPGTITYAVRRARLLVATGDAPAQATALLQALLAALNEAASAARGVATLQLRMLSASLRLVGGGAAAPSSPEHDEVLACAIAGIASRTGLTVSLSADRPCAVSDPHVAALVLTQLAVNAERHDAAESVTLHHDGCGLHVRWRGSPGRITTSRRREHRERWGLGFARIAADALGATLHPPHHDADGMVTASLEVGVPRLALPLAALRGGSVQRATRTWDEETSFPAGSTMRGSVLLSELVVRARRAEGRVAVQEGWSARCSNDLVWVAVPPHDAMERARDVVAGLAHESVLLRATDEVRQATIRGLALLLGNALGAPLPQVVAESWRSRLQRLAAGSGMHLDLPRFTSPGALDSDATFVLASRGGGHFEASDDQLWLRVSPDRRDDPAVQALLRPGDRIAIA